MADGLLTIRGFADFKKLLSEYQKLETAHNKQGAELDKLRRKSQQLDDAQSKSANNAVDGLARTAAQYLTVREAITQVINAMREKERLELLASNRSRTIAQSQQQLFMNADPSSVAEGRQLVRDIRATAVPLGIEASQANIQFGRMFSALQGSLAARKPRVFDMARALSGLVDPQTMGDIGTLGFDIQKAMPGMSADQAVGFMLSMVGQARIEDPLSYRHLIPALMAANAQFSELNPQRRQEAIMQTGALQSVIGTVTGDTTGETARTTMVNFNAVMRDVLRANKVDTSDLDMVGRVDAIMNNDKMRNKFLSSMKGKGASKPIQELIITGQLDEALEDTYTQLRERMSDVATRQELMRAGTPEIRAAQVQRQAEAIQDSKLRDRSVLGDAQKILFGDGETPGFFGARSKPGMLGTLESYYAGIAARAQIRAQGGDEVQDYIDAVMSQGRTPSALSPTDEDRSLFNATIKQLQSLQAIELEKTRKATAEQTQATINAQNSAAAAAQLSAQNE